MNGGIISAILISYSRKEGAAPTPTREHLSFRQSLVYFFGGG
jgi:hypothetical protein